MLLKYTSMIVNFMLSNILVYLLHWPVSCRGPTWSYVALFSLWLANALTGDPNQWLWDTTKRVGWVWDIPRRSHIDHPVFSYLIQSTIIANTYWLFIMCKCTLHATWHALYTILIFYSLTEEIHLVDRLWKAKRPANIHYGLKDTALCHCKMLQLKHRIKNFQNN